MDQRIQVQRRRREGCRFTVTGCHQKTRGNPSMVFLFPPLLFCCCLFWGWYLTVALNSLTHRVERGTIKQNALLSNLVVSCQCPVSVTIRTNFESFTPSGQISLGVGETRRTCDWLWPVVAAIHCFFGARLEGEWFMGMKAWPPSTLWLAPLPFCEYYVCLRLESLSWLSASLPFPCVKAGGSSPRTFFKVAILTTLAVLQLSHVVGLRHWYRRCGEWHRGDNDDVRLWWPQLRSGTHCW